MKKNALPPLKEGPPPLNSSASSFGTSSYSCQCPDGIPSTCFRSESLGIFRRKIYQGDFEIVGVGTRDNGFGTLDLTSVPMNAHVVEAYLYWNTLAPPCVDGRTIQVNRYDCLNPINCPVTVSCGSCVNMPQWWTITVSGTTNGTCSGCTDSNGTHTLKYAGDCTWKTDEVTTCPSGGPLWMLQFDSIESAWFITANGNDETGDAIYNVSGTFNCQSTNTFNLHLSSSACTFPATVTITPVFTTAPCSSSSAAPFALSVTGTCIGTCANACWSQFLNQWGVAGNDTFQPIINRVYRANVGPGSSTPIVLGNGFFCVSQLPFDPRQPLVPNDENHARYPGCGGSQGVVLVVIWEYNAGQGPTDSTRFREVAIYDGAVMVVNPNIQSIFGGVSNYTVFHNTAYFKNCKLGWGVGDADGSPNHASFNNVILNTGPAFFTGAEGHLLSAETMFVSNGQTDNQFTVFNMPPTDTDCLDWFLYVQSGNGCLCRISADLISNGPGFIVEGFFAKSLGCQTVNVLELVDNCPCVPPTNGWQININQTAWQDVPVQGILVQTGDLIDLRINPSTTCGLCTNSGPYCVPPTG